MTNWEGNKPLDKNAFLDAENLFRTTGDLRYLVVAIGKAGGENYQKTKEHVPQTLINLCNDYAENVRLMTAFERQHVVSSHAEPLPQDSVREKFREIADKFFDPTNTEMLKEPETKNGERYLSKRITFAALCKKSGIEDENLIREFRKWLKEETSSTTVIHEFDNGDFEIEDLVIERRREEIFYVRHSHRKGWVK